MSLIYVNNKKLMSNNLNQFNKINISPKLTSFEDLLIFFVSLRDKILMIENELNKTNAIIENPNNSKNINCENDPKMESKDLDVNVN